ncbi:hypothetical protein FA95DRAFT_1458901, partial [Auriscalpium vulgare]
VMFVPPLCEQRRAWVLDILQREGVASVLDVGCGEGALLDCLSHPAPWLAHTPATPAAPLPAAAKFEFAHVRTLHGLDISADDLEEAIEATRPPDVKGWAQHTRWEALDARVWEGGLEVPNSAFDGVECIVAMEVIEHLPPSVLPYFAPTLLGHYQPDLLLLTTPSYDFNPLFNPPDDPAPWGFPDPTQRTTRVFRHDDHKFEWTVAECTEWCARAADDWGYDVQMGGVGHNAERDPWGRGEGLKASQVVLFRRKEGAEWAERRRTRAAKFVKTDGAAHILRATHLSTPHPSAGKPAARELIAGAVAELMREWEEARVVVTELWREDRVAALCGGWVEVLVDALDQAEMLVLRRDGKYVDDWAVELVGALPRRQKTW